MTQDISTDISIRQWSESDWQTYRAIRLEALTENADVFGASFDGEASKDNSFWKDRLKGPDKGTAFGLYDGSTVIGLTGIYRDWNGREGVAILCMSYIRADYRRKGLSDLLYKARIDWAKAQGDIRILEVGHREGNDASRGANQRWGFVFKGIDEKHPYGNGDQARNYIYQLEI